ncbi:hypothetical protein SCLCIDRAFT_49296, partial [Scleroderma citrinum Foug A]
IKVPMLKVDGSNWIIYKSRIELAVEAQGLPGYLTGTKVLPPHPGAGKALPDWSRENAKVKQIIAASTPDTLHLKYHTLNSAHSLWEALASEFEQHSAVVAIELRRKLQGLR